MITQATPDQHALLTSISYQAKRYWKYPEEFIDIWKSELTITEKYITENRVYTYSLDDTIIGYYSIVALKEPMEFKGDTLAPGFYLDHMYIIPDHIGKGFGTIMFNHLKTVAKNHNEKKIFILADPNAVEFYKKLGCDYLKDFPSTIPNRTTPYLHYTIS